MSTVMNRPADSPGRVVGKKVHESFTRHRETNRGTRPSVASAEAIEAVIEAAFRASLRREEGYIPRLSLAILAPEDAVEPLVFEEALPLTAVSLARVSPAVARSGLYVAVWNLGDELYAWGTVRSIPISCCVIEVAAPGLLVIKHRPSEQSPKLVNVAVLEGDQIKIVDERASASADCPPLVSSPRIGCHTTPNLASRADQPPPRLRRSAEASANAEASRRRDAVDVLVELAVSMRAHGRGGTLLVVPSNSDLWRESIVHPMPYAVRPRFSRLGELALESGERPGRQWEADLSDAVEMMAGLTAVDGATVITDQYELIAFGAKIARRAGHLRVEHVIVTEPIEDAVPVIVHPTQIGGTRHSSAVQFVNDQRNVLALVASQDGRVTVFSWCQSETMVHAHRVEALL